MQYAKYYRVTYAGQDEFQVKDGFTTFVVNLGVRSYSCDYWALIGLPCKYPCACIAYKRADAKVYWDHFFSNAAYYETYVEIIYPMPKVDEFATGRFNVTIDLPRLQRLPGRPKRNRKRGAAKGPSGDGNAR